jgi:hypothetical protein
MVAVRGLRADQVEDEEREDVAPTNLPTENI